MSAETRNSSESASAAGAAPARGPRSRDPERIRELIAQGKLKGTDWYSVPPGTRLYDPVPHVAPTVDAALSWSESRVLRAITDTRPARGRHAAKRQTGEDGSERGFVCAPGGYWRIAKDANVCRTTVYLSIKSLIRKGALRVLKIHATGGRREKTFYFAPHFADVLGAWRRNSELFKTDRHSVVVRGRAKRIMTVEEAADWRIDPKRAPARGCGRGRDPGEADQAQMFDEAASARASADPPPPPEAMPPAQTRPETLPATPDESRRAAAAVLISIRPGSEAVDIVLEAFQTITAANEKDAMDLLIAAVAEQARSPFPVTVDRVVEALNRAAAKHKRSAEFPQPKPKWCIERIRGEIALAVRTRRSDLLREEQHRGLHARDRDDRIRWMSDALWLIESPLASVHEQAVLTKWLREAEEYFPAEFAEARERNGWQQERRAAG